ncbi:MAG: CsgG/HfaB family protein [Candidatus Edwardsbacteria bacterium]|nr:CsgG/HfaB family protein [Candidatus Edwardsbacteria bacterium]
MRHLLLAFLAAATVLAQPAKDPHKTTAAILDLETKGVSETETGALSERLRFEMFKTGAFDMMERGKMQDILKEQGFQQTGACNTNACAVEVGQLIGVEKMVAGSLGKVGKTYTVILRLIDVKTGRLEESVAQDYTGEIDKLMTTVLKDVARSMAAAVKAGEDQKLAQGALPQPASEGRPVYKKWWFWGGIGGATIGGALAALLGGKGKEASQTPTEPIDNPPAHPQ